MAVLMKPYFHLVELPHFLAVLLVVHFDFSRIREANAHGIRAELLCFLSSGRPDRERKIERQGTLVEYSFQCYSCRAIQCYSCRAIDVTCIA